MPGNLGTLSNLVADLLSGSKADLTEGQAMKFLSAVHDRGSLQFGDGSSDFDFTVYVGPSKYVKFDVGAGKLTFSGVAQSIGDNAALNIGDGNDVQLVWNGTYLEVTSASTIWDSCPSELDPNFIAVAYKIEDDFLTYDNTATVGGWALFEVGTGTDALADDVPGGVLLLTCQATTDNACEQINKVSAPILLAAGKTVWFEARFKLVGDATQSEVAVGLVAAGEDLTAVADVKPQDGVAFSKQDAATGFALTASKDGTNTGESGATLHTLANNTWVRLGFLIDGITSVTPYVNGVAGTPITATICDDESLAPFFLVRNGDGVTQEVLHIDYVKCVQLK